MFDLSTLQDPFTGKDTSIMAFNETLFSGNAFRTETLARADTFDAYFVFTSCESSTIDTMFDRARSKFQGRCDFTSFNTFSTTNLNVHDFVGNRPIQSMRTKRRIVQTLANGSTTLTLNHGLVDTPTRFAVTLPFNSTWWISAVNATSITLEFGTAPTQDEDINIFMEIASAQ